MSRKWAIGGVASYVGFIGLADFTDFNFMIRSVMGAWFLQFTVLYLFLEGKKFFFVPLQKHFYNEIIKHEMEIYNSYWPDFLRERIRKNREIAHEQLQYYNVHQDFADMKAESINRFLANEQVNLKVHVHKRAQTLLQNAFALEQQNQKKVINGVVQKAIQRVDEVLEESMDTIRAEIFESALIGIRQRRMTYENDPILPLVQETIKESVQEVARLTPEEQLSLVTLSDDQLATLRAADTKARQDFLNAQPAIDGSLKDYESVQAALSSWGN